MELTTTAARFFDLAFVRGLAVGFALPAPVGPVAVLCIRRALARGWPEAFAAGLGAALADTAFGVVAGLGITSVSVFVTDYEMTIGLIGGVLVLALGLVTYRSAVVMNGGAVAVNSLGRDFAGAVSVAITNPATMIAALGLFAAFGRIDVYAAPVAAFWLVAGVFTGSAIWWLILAGSVSRLRERFIANGLPWLNRVSGAIIALSGGLVIGAMVAKMLNAA